MIFGRQPAFWIGLLVTLILGAVQTLLGEGVISDVAAGKVTDIVTAVGGVLVLLAPLIAGLLIKPVVTPTAAPALPEGTSVTVITPPGEANSQVTLRAF